MIKNRIFGLAAIVVVASGLGVVTVTAHAGNAPVATSSVLTSTKGKASHSTSSRKVAASSKKVAEKKAEVKASASSKAVAASVKASSVKASSASASSAKASSVAASTSSVKVAAASSQTASSQAAASTTATSQASQTSTTQASTTRTAVAATPAAPAVQTPAQRAAAKAATIRNTTGETYVGTISGAGHSTDVIQGSMSRTSAPQQAGLAMTWGGATRLSTTDGLTTEIAGHDRSANFAWVMNLGIGSTVSVTDANGNSRSYRVYKTDDVNDQSYSTRDGKDEWNAITSAGQGEAVVLQTCISDTVNRIVWAH